MRLSAGGLPYQGKYLDIRPPQKPLTRHKTEKKSHPALTLIAGKTTLPLELQLEIVRHIKDKQFEAETEAPKVEFWSEKPQALASYPAKLWQHPIAALKSLLKSIKAALTWQVHLLGPWDLKLKVSYLGAAVLVTLLVPSLALLSQGLQAKSNLFALGSAALENFDLAKNSFEGKKFLEAETNLGEAYQNFIQAETQVKSLGRITLTLAENIPKVSSQIKTARNLIELGKNVSLLGSSLTEILVQLQDLNLNLALNKTKVPQTLTATLLNVNDNLTVAREALLQINQNLSLISPEVLPTELAASLKALESNLPLFEKAVQEGQNFLKFLISILGQDNPRKYLILFQNNSELRPSGGFIGTVAELNLFEGQVRSLEVAGVYNLDGQLTQKIVPPRPLQRISPNWGLRDSNWFLDFAKSAKTAAWFKEEIGKGTVDGVIALTPNVIEDLLEITGPIDFPDYNLTLDTLNFRNQIQQHTEFEYSRKINQPKKILTDFTPLFLEKLGSLPQEKWPLVIEALIKNLNQKQILFWFQDPAEQNFVENQGWAGRVLEAPADYLAVAHSNLAGYKTDRVIDDAINYQVRRQESGALRATLTIKRTHQGSGSPYIFYNWQNRDYIKVYTPLGSRLISARGAVIRVYSPKEEYQGPDWKNSEALKELRESFRVDPKTGTHIFTESGKTVFANWLFTEPGQTSQLTLVYELPFRLDQAGSTYSLLIQKQPGAKPATLMVSFEASENISPQWRYPESLTLTPDGFNYLGSLTQDKFLGLSFSQ
jgi:hypothetical protein